MLCSTGGDATVADLAGRIAIPTGPVLCEHDLTVQVVTATAVHQLILPMPPIHVSLLIAAAEFLSLLLQ